MTALPPKPTHDFYPLRFCPPVATSAAERHRMIELAAYFRAEKRQFVHGHEHEDWLAAQSEVDARLARLQNHAEILV